MRRRFLLGGVGAALLSHSAVLRTAGTPRPDHPPGAAGDLPPEAAVDVLLVLASDVSRSMDEEEAWLQREGTITALLNPEVLEAIGSGPHGAIGLAVFEWSGPEHQSVLIPWMRVADAQDAAHAARRIRAAPIGIGTWTAIATALDRARLMIEQAPFTSERRVIDISGDGPNNSGGSVEEARDRAIDAGIVVNGLPIMREAAPLTGWSGAPPPSLDVYYREAVTGGAGAFVLPAEDFQSFGRAMRRKLLREIASVEATTG
jgi:hypothetical protein